MNTGNIVSCSAFSLLYATPPLKPNPTSKISANLLKWHEFKLGLKSFFCVFFFVSLFLFSFSLTERSFNQHYFELLLPKLFVFSSQSAWGQQFPLPRQISRQCKRLKKVRSNSWYVSGGEKWIKLQISLFKQLIQVKAGHFWWLFFFLLNDGSWKVKQHQKAHFMMNN